MWCLLPRHFLFSGVCHHMILFSLKLLFVFLKDEITCLLFCKYCHQCICNTICTAYFWTESTAPFQYAALTEIPFIFVAKRTQVISGHTFETELVRRVLHGCMPKLSNDVTFVWGAKTNKSEDKISVLIM